MTEVKPDAILLSEGAAIGRPRGPVLDEMCEASYSYGFFRRVVWRLVLKSGKISPTFMRALNEYQRKQVEALAAMGEVTTEGLVRFLAEEPVWHNRARVRFSETHDTPRMSALNPSVSKPIAVLISTVPGIPMIQAGQEVGASNAFDWGPGTRVDWAGGDYELREFYKKVFKVRSGSDALKYGTIESVWRGGDNLLAYARRYRGEDVVVLVNFSGREVTSTLDLSFLKAGAVLKDALSDEELIVGEADRFRVTVPAHGAMILLPQS